MPLGNLAESSLPRRWPRDSVLERQMKSFESVRRSLHPQAGFALVSALRPYTCQYSAVALSTQSWESEPPQIEALEDLPGVQVHEGLDYFPRSNGDDDDEEFSYTALEEYEDTHTSDNDDLVPECPPPETDDEEDFPEIASGISAAIGIASDLKDALSPSDLQESCGEVLSKGSVTGSYGSTAIPEIRQSPMESAFEVRGGHILYEFCCDQNSAFG